VGEAINKRIKEHKLATAAIKDRRWYQLEGMEYKNELNKDKRKRQVAFQAEKLKQEKLAREERLNNPTEPNSTETHLHFQSESECSTTNLGSCTDDELYNINQNKSNSEENRVEAGLGMV